MSIFSFWDCNRNGGEKQFMSIEKKRILGFLFSVAMVMVLMPGMSLTARAEGNVAKVGDTEYATLSEAISAWTEGTTLTLLTDVTINEKIYINGNITKTLDLNGKTITLASNSNEQRVIQVNDNQTVFNLLDGSGTNAGRLTGVNPGNNDNGWSGALYINSGATVNMYGGTITGNRTKNGAGVWIDGRGHRGNAKFNMYGGLITGNTATNGGGVYVGCQLNEYAGTAQFNMYGGTITGNTATNGSNVYVDKGVMTMTGGTIDGGFSNNNYVAVSFDANEGWGTMSTQYVKKGTNTIIKANENYGTDGNKTTPAFTQEGYIFVGWNTQADGNGTNYTPGSDSINISADTTLYAKWVSPVASVTSGDTTVPYTDFPAALANWPDGSTLKLLSDVNYGDRKRLEGGTRTLDLNGRTWTGNQSDVSIQIVNNSSLTLQDSSGTNAGKITGNGSNDWHGVIWVEQGSTFNMYGGTISGNTGACGVWIDGRNRPDANNAPGAIFNMYGGLITGNKKGVYVGSQPESNAGEGYLNIYGGTITGNNCDVYIKLGKVNITNPLSNTNPIIVGMQTIGVFTNSTTISNNDTSKFISENTSYAVGKNYDGQLILATPNTVTYKVVNGTWSDDTTEDKTESVAIGLAPTSVPTGMKAAEGYTGGEWDTNPADTTITGATTFTYTFTEKQPATGKTGAESDINIAYSGKSQELVTPGVVEGGTMVYALGTDAETLPADSEYTTDIPTGTDVGSYYVWYKARGDENHLDSDPACVIVTIFQPTYTVSGILEFGNFTGTVDFSLSGNGVNKNVSINVTDGSGNYSFTGLTAGTYDVKASWNKDGKGHSLTFTVPVTAGTL